VKDNRQAALPFSKESRTLVDRIVDYTRLLNRDPHIQAACLSRSTMTRLPTTFYKAKVSARREHGIFLKLPIILR
jgi:hypothetical protein